MASNDPLAQFRRPDFTDEMRDKIMFPKVYKHKQQLFWKRVTKVFVLLLILAALVYFLTQPSWIGDQSAADSFLERSEPSDTVEKAFDFSEIQSEAGH